jgi:hypothetical protein
MRILFISSYSPLDLYMGTGEYNQRLLSYLAQQGSEIHYLSLSEQIGRRKVILRLAEIPAYIKSLRIAGWQRLGEVFFDPHWKRWLLIPLLLFSAPTEQRIIALILRCLGLRMDRGEAVIPVSGRRRIDATRTRLIHTAFIQLRPDVVIVDGTFNGDCFDALPPIQAGTCKVIVTIDVYHQRADSLRRLGATAVGNALNREEESELLDKADVIVALQGEEAAVLQELAPRRHVVTAPLAPVRLPHHGVDEVAGRCLFVGSLCDHNEVSLAWFLAEVWPEIIAANPVATLHVCGRVGEAFAGRVFPGVNLLGLVPDLGVEYAAAQVCLVPLRAGSGLKIKTVQAFAQHKPCVATSFGAQGMRHLEGSALVIADSATDYAAAVVELLADGGRREQLRAGAARAVTEYFAPEVCYGPLLEAMQHRTVLTR